MSANLWHGLPCHVKLDLTRNGQRSGAEMPLVSAVAFERQGAEKATAVLRHPQHDGPYPPLRLHINTHAPRYTRVISIRLCPSSRLILSRTS